MRSSFLVAEPGAEDVAVRLDAGERRRVAVRIAQVGCRRMANGIVAERSEYRARVPSREITLKDHLHASVILVAQRRNGIEFSCSLIHK